VVAAPTRNTAAKVCGERNKSEMPGEHSNDGFLAALQEARREIESTMNPRTKPDPALVAAINARARERRAYHKAGYLVAVVAKEDRLTDICLDSVDCYLDADALDGSRHQGTNANHPFRIYGALFAEATWVIDHDDDVDEFSDAFEYVCCDPIDGCAGKYGDCIAVLDNVATTLGFSRVGISCPWEAEWDNELELLRDAIREIAGQLVNGCRVAHADVKAALIRCPQC